MPVNPIRIKKLNDIPYEGGTVIYQMCRDIRAVDNDALLFAQELAKSKGAQLIVNYIIWNYTWEGATRRFYDWVLPSLEEVEATLRAYSIPLTVTFEDRKLPQKEGLMEKIPERACAVVIDQLPLHFMRRWKEIFLAQHNGIALYEADAHNCIPVWETSSKQEFAARTIRSKIHTKLPLFLEEYEKVSVHHENQELLKSITPIDWGSLKNKIICNEHITGVGEFVPGEVAAQKMLQHFLCNKLNDYDTARNNFTVDGQSNLSPYISHGNISRRKIIRTLLRETDVDIRDAFDSVKNGANGTLGSVAAFIEECVVRAELCDNFCYYNEKYDTAAGFPSWAKDTLNKARTDKREYLYDADAFERAVTHDEVWNAAQMQMVKTGKMHGYMRMYWAKKILEWTKSPEDAMRIAVYLNDMYELDGRDPAGYVGCAWSIGGVHDRPWFGRPMFGTVRYMAISGVEKRGKTDLYKQKFLGESQTLFS